VRLSHLFLPEAIKLDLTARSRQGVIKELVRLLDKNGLLMDANATRDDLLAREKMSSTGIGKGVAIPHAATVGVNQPLIAYGRSGTGVDFTSHDGKPAHHIFLLLGPPSRQPLHLRILAQLSRLLIIPQFLEGLDAATDSESVLGLVQDFIGERDEIEDPSDMPKVLVLGESDYALAMAAHISFLGCRVSFWSQNKEKLEAVRAMRGINVEGAVSGFAGFVSVNGELETALENIDMIMVVTLADEQAEVAHLLSPHLAGGQSIVLHQGRLGGALMFLKQLIKTGPIPQIKLAEAQGMLYDCSMIGPAQVRIMRLRGTIPVAALPASGIADMMPRLTTALPYFVAGDNSLQVGLNYLPTYMEPTLMVLNAAWVEQRAGKFRFFKDGASPSVCSVLEKLDEERISVAHALGFEIHPAVEWLRYKFGGVGDSLFEAIQSTPQFSEINAPPVLEHPSLATCVTCGLVPLLALGEGLGLEMTMTRTIIYLACTLLGRDLIEDGRSLSTLGLDEVDLRKIKSML
jgi:opine dehydrogenase